MNTRETNTMRALTADEIDLVEGAQCRKAGADQLDGVEGYNSEGAQFIANLIGMFIPW